MPVDDRPRAFPEARHGTDAARWTAALVFAALGLWLAIRGLPAH